MTPRVFYHGLGHISGGLSLTLILAILAIAVVLPAAMLALHRTRG